MKTLIVVDMQNDFITGSLANNAAELIITPIKDFISDFDGNIIFTRDTHFTNYLNTAEGKKLPIPHCIKDTEGWNVESTLIEAAKNNSKIFEYIDKLTFGFSSWLDIAEKLNDEIYIVGTCTDICVVSNALILKAQFPDKKIFVLANLCAGLTKEKHEAALETMRSCQIEVI